MSHYLLAMSVKSSFPLKMSIVSHITFVVSG